MKNHVASNKGLNSLATENPEDYGLRTIGQTEN